MTASIGSNLWEGWYHIYRDESPCYYFSLLMILVVAFLRSSVKGFVFVSNKLP